MQIPRFTPKDHAPESACLANIPGDFRGRVEITHFEKPFWSSELTENKDT